MAPRRRNETHPRSVLDQLCMLPLILNKLWGSRQAPAAIPWPKPSVARPSAGSAWRPSASTSRASPSMSGSRRGSGRTSRRWRPPLGSGRTATLGFDYLFWSTSRRFVDRHSDTTLCRSHVSSAQPRVPMNCKPLFGNTHMYTLFYIAMLAQACMLELRGRRARGDGRGGPQTLKR